MQGGVRNDPVSWAFQGRGELETAVLVLSMQSGRMWNTYQVFHQRVQGNSRFQMANVPHFPYYPHPWLPGKLC